MNGIIAGNIYRKSAFGANGKVYRKLMRENNDKTNHKISKRCKYDKFRILRINPTKKKKIIRSNTRLSIVAKNCAAGDGKLNSPKSIDLREKFQKYCLPPSSVQVLVNGFVI